MYPRFTLRTGAVIALAAVCLPGLSLSARAQDNAQTPGNDPASGSEVANQPIKLDLENADLYSALKLLFNQVKADYTLDPNLRTIPITVHITKLPFRFALDTVLRAANAPVPLTYKLENGVYSIIEKRPDIDPNPVDSNIDPVKEGTGKLLYKKFVGNGVGEIKFNSYFLSQILGAKLIPAVIGGQQQGGQGGQGGFGGGGFGGGLGGGGLGGFGGGGGLGGGGLGGFGGGGLGGFGGGGMGGLGGGGLGGFGGGGMGGFGGSIGGGGGFGGRGF